MVVVKRMVIHRWGCKAWSYWLANLQVQGRVPEDDVGGAQEILGGCHETPVLVSCEDTRRKVVSVRLY
jgi:hypothetical protein